MDAKSIDTPMGSNSKLDADGSGLDVNDASARIHARFQDYPTESHLKVAQRILRHLKKTGTWFCSSHQEIFFVILIMLDIQLVERVPHEWLMF